MKNKDNLPQFLCDKCFKNSGLEESLTLGSFLPRNCIVCGETVSKDYNFVWGKDIEHVWGKSKKFLKKDLKMEDGKTDFKVKKEPETIELKLEGWQIGHFLPFPTVEEAKNYLKKLN